MPNHISRNYWIREIANFLNSVSLLSGKNKFPTAAQIYDWTYYKFQDVIMLPNYIKKLTSNIIDDYEDYIEINKTYPEICKEFNTICEKYFRWIANELSICGFVSRAEIFEKLNKLI